MINFPEIKFLAVLVAFIFNSALGFFWYSEKSPIGKFWMKEMAYNSSELEPNMLYFAGNFVATFVAMWGLALVVGFSKASTFGEGLLIGLITWFVFIPSMTYATVAFEQRKITVWAVFAGYQLVTFLLFGGLFAVW